MAEKIAVTIILAAVGAMVAFYFYRMFKGDNIECRGCCQKKSPDNKQSCNNDLGKSEDSNKSQG